jgi:hypothetical protein
MKRESRKAVKVMAINLQHVKYEPRRWFWADADRQRAENEKRPDEIVFPVTIDFEDGGWENGYAVGSIRK